jgi:Domain of unknown function (DUF4389)
VAYPVSVTVEPALTGRNRLTVGLRLLLAIPHLILVGGLGFGATRQTGNDAVNFGGETGLLGAVAVFLAIVSWFTLVFAAGHFPGIRQFTAFYLRWRVRALAYVMLLADLYPPFGDGAYPASLTIADPAARDRLSIGFRLLLAIPHFIVLTFLVLAWWITAVIAWLLILFTGAYPAGLFDFGVGVLRWFIRVEAYLLLMIDEYPPFTLAD